LPDWFSAPQRLTPRKVGLIKINGDTDAHKRIRYLPEGS
jgi:hypothetical protein